MVILGYKDNYVNNQVHMYTALIFKFMLTLQIGVIYCNQWMTFRGDLLIFN